MERNRDQLQQIGSGLQNNNKTEAVNRKQKRDNMVSKNLGIKHYESVNHNNSQHNRLQGADQIDDSLSRDISRDLSLIAPSDLNLEGG